MEPTTVDPPRPTTVAVSPATTVLVSFGATVQLTAEVRDQNGNVMAGQAVVWTSDPAEVVSVAPSGLATANANGEATVTATAGEAQGSAAVAVEQRPAAVTVSPAADTLVQADTLRLSATASDANGHSVADAEFLWTSGDSEVATVDSTGLVTGGGPGETAIAASTSGVTGGADLTVVAPLPTTLVVSPDTVLLVALGAKVQLAASVFDQIGRALPDTAVAWTSSDTVVASVDAEGWVAAVGDGAATIVASAGDARASATVRVARVVDEVSVSPAADTLFRGIELELSAEALDANGHPIPHVRFAWSSSDTGVIEVDERGVARAVAEGEARVTAASGAVRGTSDITVAVHPDRAALVALYEATDGPSWRYNRNWLTDEPVGNWYGVETNEQGRVTGIRLVHHFLTGTLPPQLASLDRLEVLDLRFNSLTGGIPHVLSRLKQLEVLGLGDNRLAGSIPPELGKLSDLTTLYLEENRLTGPIPPELASLTNLTELVLRRNDLTGPIPKELTSLKELRVLDVAWNGLSGSLPPELGELSALERLSLFDNDLTGPLPSEWGKLTSLRELLLDGLKLSGTIPPQLGSLGKLQVLWLGRTGLEGTLPAELGNLAALTDLLLNDNQLTGQIPPSLGNLSNLKLLFLEGNQLSGPIPPQLGELASLERLSIQYNRLTGEIPAELGRLANLQELTLGRNQLSGPIPAELGGLTRLQRFQAQDNDHSGPLPAELSGMRSIGYLSLTGNKRLVGSLPAGFTGFKEMWGLHTAGTELCAPNELGFLAWLSTVQHQRVKVCDGGGSLVYLVQSVQSREYPVPLVAGRPALLRVFVVSREAAGLPMPDVHARFFVGGTEVHSVEIASSASRVAARVDEGSLRGSANALIPGGVVRPGLEVVVEVDPHERLDPSLGVRKRIPATGRLAVGVSEMPQLRLDVIPFLFAAAPDSAIIALTEGMSADPYGHELLGDTRRLLPVDGLEVTDHSPVSVDSNDAYDLLRNVSAIRYIEGMDGHVMGMMSGPVTGAAGLAHFATRESFSVPSSSVMAHELGHNMGLGHAPCGAREYLEQEYPQPDGSIGAWGYDHRSGELVAPDTPDLCPTVGPNGFLTFTSAAHSGIDYAMRGVSVPR